MLAFIEGLNHWQICGIVIWLLLQGAVFAPFPEEVITLSMGVLWSQGRVSFPEAFLSIFAGLMPADCLMVFVAGRFSGRAFFKKPSVLRALELVREKGKPVIFLIRFTPFVRGPVYASVGLSGMRVRDFLKIDISAALIQVPSLLLLGAYIGEKTGSIAAAYKLIAIGAISVALVFLSVYFVREKLLVRKT